MANVKSLFNIDTLILRITEVDKVVLLLDILLSR